MGRRVEYLETVAADAGGSQYLATETNNHYRFVYDGYLCIQRLDAAANNSMDQKSCFYKLFKLFPFPTSACRPRLMHPAPGRDGGRVGRRGASRRSRGDRPTGWRRARGARPTGWRRARSVGQGGGRQDQAVCGNCALFARRGQARDERAGGRDEARPSRLEDSCATSAQKAATKRGPPVLRVFARRGRRRPRRSAALPS